MSSSGDYTLILVSLLQIEIFRTPLKSVGLIQI
jgi:hypothetical protein